MSNEKKAIGYERFFATRYDDRRYTHRVRRYDERLCVEGPGVEWESDTTTDDPEVAERLRALIQQAYWRGRIDGAEATTREIRSVLGFKQ